MLSPPSSTSVKSLPCCAARTGKRKEKKDALQGLQEKGWSSPGKLPLLCDLPLPFLLFVAPAAMGVVGFFFLFSLFSLFLCGLPSPPLSSFQCTVKFTVVWRANQSPEVSFRHLKSIPAASIRRAVQEGFWKADTFSRTHFPHTLFVVLALSRPRFPLLVVCFLFFYSGTRILAASTQHEQGTSKLKLSERGAMPCPCSVVRCSQCKTRKLLRLGNLDSTRVTFDLRSNYLQ